MPDLFNYEAHYDLCDNCGEMIAGYRASPERGYLHITGSYAGKHRCGSESGKPYGLDAEPGGRVKLESALASERAMHTQRRQAHSRALAAEATIAQVRQWHDENGYAPGKERLTTILAAAPTAELDAALAEARAGALEVEADRLAEMSHVQRNLGEDRVRYLAYAYIAVSMRHQAAHIREAQK